MGITAYIAIARAIGGRSGFVRSDSQALKLDLAIPGSPGIKANSTNPEELFACGLASSFGEALEEAGQMLNVSVVDMLVQAEVRLEQEYGLRSLSTALHVTLPGMSHAMAASMVATAYRRCPYARAIRGNVRMVFHINNRLFLKVA